MLQRTTNVITFAALVALALASRQCTTSNVCKKPGTYCALAGTCETLSYSRPFPERAPSRSAYAGGDTLVLTSGLRFYHTSCADNADPHCIFGESQRDEENESVTSVVLEDTAERQAACVSNLVSKYSAVATITMGGLTGSAQKDQFDALSAYFLHRVTRLHCPHFVSLGPSDYPVDALDTGIISRITELVRSAALSPNVLSVDLSIATVMAKETGLTIFNRGSLSYAMDVGNFVIIVLHDSLSKRSASYMNVDGTVTTLYEISRPKTWLLRMLKLARNKNVPVIIMPHSLGSLETFAHAYTDVANALSSGVVRAIISSVGKGRPGKEKSWMVPGRNVEIPTFVAGDASYDLVTKVTLKGKDVSVQLFNSDDGVRCRPASR